MDLKHTFNEDAVNYDRARPGYVGQLFRDIIDYSGIQAGQYAIEIGIGTGQATPPFLAHGVHVTAVELGENLAAYCRQKFAEEQALDIVCDDFMAYDAAEACCDLIYSATAFHWLPNPGGYQKAMKLLKPGGTLTLFWNHPYPNREEDPSNRVNRRVYAMHRPIEKPLREWTDTSVRIAELTAAGYVDVQAKLYQRVRTLTTEEYIALINTYSDHRALSAAQRNAFEEDMRRGLAEVGGHINIYDTQALYLARKP